MFIDTHTHITDEAFEGYEDEFIAHAVGNGVTIMLLADIDSKERKKMYDAVGRHSGILFPMLGLYPGSVGKDWKEEFDAVVNWNGQKPIAIGEIGLDYHYGAEFADEQKEAFRAQLELAAERDLPVNIHLRDATEDFFDIIEDCRHLGLRGNLHAFSGSYETFLRLQKYGDWRIGVGGVVTFKNSGLQETVKKIPLERILLETDAPYLTPVPYRGKRNESAMTVTIAAKIAELKNKDIEEVAEITTENARNLFSLF